MDKPRASRYFKAIKGIWEPISHGRLIIPFCTPIFLRPTALVIGTNHTDFAPDKPKESAAIARALSLRLPTVNSLVEHFHLFAKELRRICTQARIKVDCNWMATNRYAVQTDSDGLKLLKKHKDFPKCQDRMDDLLREFVDNVRPVNLILAGRDAISLYYNKGQGNIRELKCIRLRRGSVNINVIPIFHPSASFGDDRATIAPMLSKSFVP
jgi:hypothetical protein